VPNAPVGLGSGPLTFNVEVSDELSGLDLVIVAREQDGETKDIVRKQYNKERTFKDKIAVNLPGRAAGLLEGPATITITAFDRSILSNRAAAEISLKVDYHPPKVEVLSTQHNVTMGGCELVFYRVADRDQIVSFVKVGASLFQGFKAALLDPAFSEAPDVYFAFFAFPLDYDAERDKISVFVRDQVGNSVSAPVYFRVGNFSRAKRAIKLSEQFMAEKVEPLYKQYIEKKGRVEGRPLLPMSPSTDPDELIERFRKVNEDYRALQNELLQPVFATPKPQKLWTTGFGWLPGRTRSFFGEEQSFTYLERYAGMMRSQGVDLAAAPNAPVPASNSGIIIFSDDLGIYGKTLIIDHGFGLTSLYAQLKGVAERSGLALKEGDRVEKNEIIGFTGSSGLADADSLHFEMRLVGTPVRPAEWWDKRWVSDHVDQKIAQIKKVLGIKIITPID
jgi:murein DD-endopeptidase MepM/ murein hydrolase activator NlpD